MFMNKFSIANQAQYHNISGRVGFDNALRDIPSLE